MDGEFEVRKIILPKPYLALNFLQPPPSSTRLHVLGYSVSHNACGAVWMYGTTDMNLVMESTSTSLLVITVAAVNVLGTGEESDITGEFCAASVFVKVAINFAKSK